MLEKIAATVFVFGLLVFVHELGHFITAKLTGMRVDEFAIGFGPRLVHFRYGETVYSIRLIPLGGFNDIAGMAADDNDAGDRGYCRKPILSRMIVILAGSAMNFILPIILFFGIFFFYLSTIKILIFLSEVFMLTEFGNWIEQGLTWVVEHLDEPLWNITIVILLGVGLFFTITTGLVQLRLFPASIREMWFGRATEGNSLTPFQAFATGLASRVGVGNISGVATAIALGGEGAVFWMWVTAFIGMSSAFAESTLAQVFKIQDKDGSFRGGPAYYITQGLKSRCLAVAFAVSLIFTFGFAFNSVQANSIVEATKNAWNWQGEYVGLVLVVLTEQ